jgi:hypothetical protein
MAQIIIWVVILVFGVRDEPLCKRVLLKGETKRRRLGIPMFLGKVR